ncbi:S8 family serine peptidase [Kribbella solani]|uniref:S8 family peptidase n=1 Tax=Kribbella solani TaxID=236067 RepID=UPI0029AC84CD|nr:S8 family serine peptidase [Kribbella solani]MDX3001777.1 S8 family serine peptidase [Kribbella solani]
MRAVALVLAVASTVLSTVPAYAQPVGKIVNAGSADAVSGSYLVVLKDGAPPEVAAKYGARVVERFGSALSAVLVEAREEQARRLAADPSVSFVEQNTKVHSASRDRPVQSAAVPCGLDRLDQVALPLDGVYRYPPSAGAGVNVYLVDSGIDYQHPDLQPRAKPGFDAFGGDGSDQNGDGTAMAGVIGGTKYGVAKKATLVSVKVLDADGGGTLAGVIAGLDWITAHAKKPAVANFVIGYTLSDALDDAVRNSIASGVTYVLSAGASTHDVSTTSPARVAEAITVGSSDCADKVAAFSNYGAGLDLYAPGVDIPTDAPGGGITTQEGTNVSAAHASGAAALYLSNHPRRTPAAVATALTTTAIQNTLTGVPTPTTPNRLLHVPDR